MVIQNGPHNWPNADGLLQSPIDINQDIVKNAPECEPMKFVNYHRVFDGEIVNNGHSRTNRGQVLRDRFIDYDHLKLG
ncbi:unnamed protein product [Enterobius vermicularis]|uniref:Alpha-carbonic anhydrase domain-containing protein n=1 Tax=Enterobius vermicularis TaxID=51028 RepID=A0A0N4VMV1_ENTVE|nr:unnamed protein product [Enterobius vermicularis]